MLLSCAQSPRVSCAAMTLTAFCTLQVYHKLRELFTIWIVMECNANQNVITAMNGEEATTIAYTNTTTPVLTNTSSSSSNTSYLYPENKKVKLPPPPRE